MGRFVSRLGVWFFGLVIVPIGLVYSSLTAVLWWGDRQQSSPAPEGSSVYSRSREPHGLELIDDGLVSLRRRLELIDGAESSVELEFFIYQLDLSARLLTERAVAAANRGVRVRLLVDFAAPVLKLAPSYAKELERRGVEVRYYNTSSLLRVVSSQHRSHRKLLLVDGRKAITGGRNIGDEYFNLAPLYNFRDSDILVEGPIVQAMRSSFEHYWSSELTDRADALERDADGVDPGFFADPRTLAAVRQDIERATAAKEATRQRHVCRDLAFATDHSGILSTNRQVFHRISELLGEARREVVGESPYLVLRPDGMGVLRTLRDRGVRQMILTNSLASTDAFYTVSALTFTLGGLEDAGVDVRVYDGSAPTDAASLDGTLSPRWGLHAKRAVIDRRHVVIGTYNVYPRSANLNSELILICRDQPELAAAMLADIARRSENSRRLFGGDRRPLEVLIQGADARSKVLYATAIPLANLFAFLL